MANAQSESLDLRLQPGHLVRRLQQAHNVLWAERIQGSLTSRQFAVLDIVQQNPEIDQRSLGELAGMDRSTTAEVVRRLVARGLLLKVKDIGDGRRNLLRLTRHGTGLLRRTLPAAAEVSERLVEALSERDRRNFLRILNLLVDAHHQRLRDLGVATASSRDE